MQLGASKSQRKLHKVQAREMSVFWFPVIRRFAGWSLLFKISGRRWSHWFKKDSRLTRRDTPNTSVSTRKTSDPKSKTTIITSKTNNKSLTTLKRSHFTTTRQHPVQESSEPEGFQTVQRDNQEPLSTRGSIL